MTATAADYAWWQQWRPDWAEAYCVTLVGDTTAQRVLDALGATETGVARGFDAFYDRAVDGYPDDYDESRPLVGVVDLDGGWTVIAEVNGFVGVTERLMGPMSPGRTIVSHFRNINAAYRFHWWRDGQLLLDVDLLFPTERFGAEPDAVVDDLRGAGVPLDDDEEFDQSAAGFALAERITGVQCTPDLFERGDYVVATVNMPGHDEHQRYGDALRATWRTPAAW